MSKNNKKTKDNELGRKTIRELRKIGQSVELMSTTLLEKVDVVEGIVHKFFLDDEDETLDFENKKNYGYFADFPKSVDRKNVTGKINRLENIHNNLKFSTNENNDYDFVADKNVENYFMVNNFASKDNTDHEPDLYEKGNTLYSTTDDLYNTSAYAVSKFSASKKESKSKNTRIFDLYKEFNSRNIKDNISEIGENAKEEQTIKSKKTDDSNFLKSEAGCELFGDNKMVGQLKDFEIVFPHNRFKVFDEVDLLTPIAKGSRTLVCDKLNFDESLAKRIIENIKEKQGEVCIYSLQCLAFDINDYDSLSDYLAGSFIIPESAEKYEIDERFEFFGNLIKKNIEEKKDVLIYLPTEKPILKHKLSREIVGRFHTLIGLSGQYANGSSVSVVINVQSEELTPMIQDTISNLILTTAKNNKYRIVKNSSYTSFKDSFLTTKELLRLESVDSNWDNLSDIQKEKIINMLISE